MRVLRGTLTFVLGMVIGIILFVLAIGGAVVVIGTQTTVGQLQDNFTQEGPIAPDSKLYGQTILDAVKSVISDMQNMDSLTLKTLYEHYGLSVLNGISGIDFTTKDFYNAPVNQLLSDLSIVVNSFTLSDISGLADVDFSEYGLPVLDENLDNNIKTAIDNIMSSFKGDLSVRKIKNDFGIDIGVNDNALIAAIQDVSLSSFGQVVNALTLDKLLDVDSDSFIFKGENRVYVKVDEYQAVSKAELKNANYSPAVGVETFIAGANDTDNDGTTDTLVEKELRYVVKSVKAEDGSVSDQYVVDNSCYGEQFNADETDKTFYRHVEYKVPTSAQHDVNKLYVLAYANRIASIKGANFTLRTKGFAPLNDFVKSAPSISGTKVVINDARYKLENGSYENSDVYYVMDETLTKDSMLRTLDEGENAGSRKPFLRIHKGTSATLLQIVSNMSVVELQDADGLLDSLTIGDVVDTDKEGTAMAIKSLKDCKLSEIGTEINNLKIDELIKIDDASAPIMKALAKRGCTLDDLDTVADSLTIGEVMDIEFDSYVEDANGAYIAEQILVPYNKYAHDEAAPRFEKRADGSFTDAASGATGENIYIKVPRYRLYNPDTDAGHTRYNLTQEGSTALALQQMARRGYTLDQIGTQLNNMFFDELIRIKETDSVLMKSLSKKDATLDNLGSVVDELKIDEVIEIDEHSSRIMKSLAARDCLVKDLGTVSDDLTLAETVDINFYKYEPTPAGTTGKFVKIVEEDNYAFYDGNEFFEGAERYNKINGTYVSAADGKFVKSVHFTLYNPAEHRGLATYNRVTDAGTLGYEPSSAVLQRMAYSTLGEFSSAFDALSLGDVMDIDIDVLTRDDTTEGGTSYFYYDSTNKLFKRQGADFDATSVDSKLQNFKVVAEGESSSVIKRLAYVPVNNLSGAMEIVMKDMLLSELIDVYEFSMVSEIRNDYTTNPPANSEIKKEDRFIVAPVGADEVLDKDGNIVETKPYTFVYDKTGKYIKRSYRFVEADVTTLTKTATKTFSYQNTSDILDLIPGKIYYKGTKNGNVEYVNNYALCIYVQSKSSSPSDKLYKRVEGTGENTQTVDAYDNTSENLYVLVNGKYVKYNPNDLSHLGEKIYTKETGTFFVEKSTPGVDGDSSYACHAADVFYTKQYCENIYIKNNGGAYVIINGKAVAYDSTLHGDAVRYTAVMGYLAQANEVYQTSDEVVYHDPIASIALRVTVENEKSEAVLRMLARDEVTIANINDVVKDATISDLMEVTEGSLFYDFKDSKLNNLSGDVEDAFAKMTMGQLMVYASITDIDKDVKAAIAPITLDNFFRSLTFSSTAGIVIDLEKAYGYGA